MNTFYKKIIDFNLFVTTFIPLCELAHNSVDRSGTIRRSRFSYKKCECLVVWAALRDRSYEGIGFMRMVLCGL